MKTHYLRLILLLSLFVTPITAAGQEATQTFTLPDARVGEEYRADIEAVLRDTYRLQLDAGGKTAIIQWTLATGRLSPGLAVRTDGLLVGTPPPSSDGNYSFQLKVADMSANKDDLFIKFALAVLPGRLRLSKIEGPRLVPLDGALMPVIYASTTPPGELISSSVPSATIVSATSDPAVTGAPRESTLKDGAKKKDSADKKATDDEAKTLASSTKAEEANPYSTKYMRAIFGMEQSGASSATSESHPFIDFFFNAPLKTHLGAWGNVRLTSTPQQIAAFVSSTKNVSAAIGDDKINDLATSFDFRLGTEYQLNTDSKHRVSLITGFGATSPLTAPAQSAQIFEVPADPTNSQFDNFFKDYPEAKGKTYIAFVRPERDRFLRQYFAGLRLKNYSDDERKFPSMLDITFGQNSAVTGGQLRHFVVGVDGSYHLLFNNKSMYIFGSANLKFGGAKMVRTPYILDPVDSGITLTSPGLLITSRQMNRDVFRIGFGVDLVELFKDKSPEKK